MLRISLAGMVVLAALGAGSAQAASLSPTMEPALSDPLASGFYAEIFGGASLPGTLNFVGGTQPDLDAGWAFGGAVGWQTGLGGLSLEVDALRTRRKMAMWPNVFESTTTLMANAKYTFSLTDAFDVYVAAGLGAYAITNQYEPDPGSPDWGTGYQFMVGADLNVTDKLAVFAEYRYQNSFAPIDIDGDAFVANSAVLAGLKYRF